MFTFETDTAENLWNGVVGVSNAGKKKGRGKRVGRKKQTDLNRGQILGTGNEMLLSIFSFFEHRYTGLVFLFFFHVSVTNMLCV